MNHTLYNSIEEKLKGTNFKISFDSGIIDISDKKSGGVYIDFYESDFLIKNVRKYIREEIKYAESDYKDGFISKKIYGDYCKLFSLLNPILFRKEKIKNILNGI